VYHHFDSKQALFEAVLVALEIRTTERVAAAAATRTDPWEGALAGLDEFLDQCCDETYGRLCWQEGPIALGWARWKECEEKYAYGLVEGFLRALAGAGYLEDAPLATTTQLVVSLLGGAGLAIAEADGAQKQRARDDCAMLMRRMLYGLRATTR
jgi:AcrR family transcriptional regulator